MNAENENTRHLDAQEAVQVLQNFLAVHQVDGVKIALLAALQSFALNEKKGILDIAVTEEELAALFDDLVGLVAAVQELAAQGKVSGIPHRQA